MIICAGTTGIAAQIWIVIAFVTDFTIPQNAIAARPFAAGFASAKASVVAFLECAGFTAFAGLTWHTDFTDFAIIAGFVAIYDTIAAIRCFGAIRIAAAIFAGAADGIIRCVDELRNAVYDLTIIAGFVAVHNAVAAISGPIAHITVGRFVVVIPSITHAVWIFRFNAFITGLVFGWRARTALDGVTVFAGFVTFKTRKCAAAVIFASDV